MVEEKEMPLDSYTNFGLHPEANLSDEQRQILIDWAKAQMDSLKRFTGTGSREEPRVYASRVGQSFVMCWVGLIKTQSDLAYQS